MCAEVTSSADLYYLITKNTSFGHITAKKIQHKSQPFKKTIRD